MLQGGRSLGSLPGPASVQLCGLSSLDLRSTVCRAAVWTQWVLAFLGLLKTVSGGGTAVQWCRILENLHF